MSIEVEPALMTTEDLFALPESSKIGRELIAGELIETRMTTRGPVHSLIEATIVTHLNQWRAGHPESRGRVRSGEAGFRIRRDPDTTVGIDVAYAAADLPIAAIRGKSVLDGPPILAVEILSPTDRHHLVVAKVRAYLDAGVRQVWVVDPDFETVTVHRPDARPALFGRSQELSGEPDLPGFRVPVDQIFD